MTRKYVIDTNVLEIANFTINKDQFFDVISLLIEIRNTEKMIVMDLEGDIIKEYFRHTPNGSFSRIWLNQMIAKKQVHFYSNKISNKHHNHLREKLKFDRSDLKFIGVAQHTCDDPHIIINETDSDWNTEVCHYLLEELNICVQNCKQALNEDT
ncbi:MAG: hypothetical protein KAX49_20005 [Halanaerobiales bacterium]|nr:hypothetical protein [Halanaerobiales bacterium]